MAMIVFHVSACTGVSTEPLVVKTVLYAFTG